MSLGHFLKELFTHKRQDGNTEDSVQPIIIDEYVPATVMDEKAAEKKVEPVADAIVAETEKVLEDEETACPVCFDQYVAPGPKEPTTLMCGHTLCRDCYKSLPIDNYNNKDCPNCRHKIMTVDNPSHTVQITQLIDKYNVVTGQMKQLLRIVKTPNIEQELRDEINKTLSDKHHEDLSIAMHDIKHLADKNCEQRLQVQRETYERELKEKIKLVVEAKDNIVIEKLGRLKNQLDQEKLVAVQSAAHDVGEHLHAQICKLTLQNETLESRLKMYNIVKDASGVDLADLVNKLQAQLEVEREQLEMTKAGMKIELDALRRLVAEKEVHRDAEIDQMRQLKQQVSDLQRDLVKQEVKNLVGDNDSYAREMKIMRERLAELEISNESKSRYINDLKAEALKSKNGASVGGGQQYVPERVVSPGAGGWNYYGNNNNAPPQQNYGDRRDEGTSGRTGKFFTHKNS